MERDTASQSFVTCRADFNPRAPHGARLSRCSRRRQCRLFQSTRSAWSATAVGRAERLRREISIHALRMERDARPALPAPSACYFNPRAPHGARLSVNSHCYVADSFQSTRSAWSATWYYLLVNLSTRFQSTRSAWSATAHTHALLCGIRYFNPRAPHGARRGSLPVRRLCARFQSTRSAWSATRHPDGRFGLQSISIHALRMERDGPICRTRRYRTDFNPRAPHGARLLQSEAMCSRSMNFNPRAPHGARQLRTL